MNITFNDVLIHDAREEAILQSLTKGNCQNFFSCFSLWLFKLPYLHYISKIFKPMEDYSWGFGAMCAAGTFCGGLAWYRDKYSKLGYLGAVIGFIAGIGIVVPLRNDFGESLLFIAFFIGIVGAFIGFLLAKGWYYSS